MARKSQKGQIRQADLLEIVHAMRDPKWINLKVAWLASAEPELYAYVKSQSAKGVQFLVDNGYIRGDVQVTVSLHNLMVHKFVEGFWLGQKRRAKISGDEMPINSSRRPKKIDSIGGKESDIGPECLEP